MLAGQRSLALESIDYMESTMTEEMLRLHSPPMADWLEFFLAMRVHVLIRFGMWDELLALQMPEDQDMYCVTAVMRHYGKGIAYASTSNLAKAHEQRQLFRDAAKRVPPSRLDYPNTIVDVVKVATAMLDGEIGYRHGNYEVAFASCRHLQSVPLLTPGLSAEDALTYTESWGWMLPARHPYGALSLEQGLVEQAATAYAEDLGLAENLVRAHQLPRNVWALHGPRQMFLYADALINMTPWSLWDIFTGKPNSKAPTIEVKALLERAPSQEEDGANVNPGLLHLYIHFIEMSPNPELGINAADHLRDLVPDAGHIHHMPTHLDILIGDWLEQFIPIQLHVMVRFGMLEELKRKELQHDPSLYAGTTATTHYARGIACAATGDIENARKEQDLFHQAWARVPEDDTHL